MNHETETVPCAKCHKPTGPLALFPGNICLDCYRPIGDRLARTMTADKLAQMWGAKPKRR